MIKNSTSPKPRTPRKPKVLDETVHTIPETAPAPEPAKGATKMSPLAIGLIIVVILTAAILGVKSMIVKPDDRKGSMAEHVGTPPPPAPGQSTPEEIQALIAKVATHIDVKQGESPTVATIQNADMLRAQNPTFYKDAQIGDRLLIWSDKAVLYSPSLDKVLSVLPISLPANVNGSGTSTASAPSSVPLSSILVEVRNGSGIAGIGGAYVTKIKAAGFGTYPATDAKSKTPYPASFIVTDGTVPDDAIAQLQQVTGASVTSMPAAEGKMKGHVLVILGLDAKK